jgi:hypothetical protein
MSHGSDKRLSSYAWQQFRKRILRRDLHRCQWRLDGCTEYADQVDHINPRVWDGALLDERNCVAACGHCNRKRHDLRPGEYGSYGTQPRPFFSTPPKPRGGLLTLSPQRRWSVIRADYSRKERAG